MSAKNSRTDFSQMEPEPHSELTRIMSLTTVDERMSDGPPPLVRHRNPVAPYFLVIGTAVEIPVAVVGSILLGVPRYWGWTGTAALILLAFVALYVGWSFFLFLSVDIRPGQIVLRAPLRRIHVDTSGVERIELNPPVRSLSMDMPWWKPWSKLVIHRTGTYPIDASVMPDGLKLRIANALDPANFPLPDRD